MGRRRTLPNVVPRACAHCGEIFTPIPKKWKQKLCSKSCQWAVHSRPKNLNGQLSRSTALKRGDSQRGRGEGKTYIKFAGHHLHRILAEQKIGRELRKGEIVHHLDGNPRNNNPENLEVLMSSGEHIHRHMKELQAARRRAAEARNGAQ